MADFEREFIQEQATVTPAPYTCRHSTDETDNFKAKPEHLEVVQLWDKLPHFATPTSTAGWVELGRAVRRDRALADVHTGLKWLVGGDLHLTTLRQGERTIRRVHRFKTTRPTQSSRSWSLATSTPRRSPRLPLRLGCGLHRLLLPTVGLVPCAGSSL